MFIFAAGIVVSIVLYIYNKVAILRTSNELIQVYYNSKSRVYLGLFLIFFGINQYLAYQLTFVLIISIIFIALGIFQVYHGIKASKHYNSEYKRLYEDE